MSSKSSSSTGGSPVYHPELANSQIMFDLAEMKEASTSSSIISGSDKTTMPDNVSTAILGEYDSDNEDDAGELDKKWLQPITGPGRRTIRVGALYQAVLPPPANIRTTERDERKRTGAVADTLDEKAADQSYSSETEQNKRLRLAPDSESLSSPPCETR
eukprot:m.148065 g.148065  ORF g.148065 m.148065 type:complete len:159 (+) comp17790_c0_seq2:280-756(+)